jgi:hypothetical protein
MAITHTPRGTDPPRRSAANDEQEKATTHPASKRKPKDDDRRVEKLNPSDAKVINSDITEERKARMLLETRTPIASHDSRTMANIARTDRGPNGPDSGSDPNPPPKTTERQLVSVELTFNTESV